MSRSSDHHYLLAEFGKSIGSPGFSFTENNEFRLYIENDIVDLRYDHDRQILVLAAVLANPLVEKKSELYLNVLELNLSGIISGSGSVGYNRADNKLIYADSILISETSTKDFNNFMLSSIAMIRSWKKLLNSGDLLYN